MDSASTVMSSGWLTTALWLALAAAVAEGSATAWEAAGTPGDDSGSRLNDTSDVSASAAGPGVAESAG